MSLVDLSLLSGLEPDTKDLEQVRNTLVCAIYYSLFYRKFVFQNLSKVHRIKKAKQSLDRYIFIILVLIKYLLNIYKKLKACGEQSSAFLVLCNRN